MANTGPANNPRLSIGYKNNVEVNMAGKIHLVDDLALYEKEVNKGTWNAVLKYAEEYVSRLSCIPNFSSRVKTQGEEDQDWFL